MLARLCLLSLLVLTACAEDDDPAPGDAGLAGVSGGGVGGGGGGGSGGQPSDAAVPDSGAPPDDAASDAGNDAASDDGGQDAATDGGPLDVVATPGARCALSERIALFEVLAYGPGTTPSALGTAYDVPNPAYGEPEITRNGCDFHRAPGPCGNCEVGDTCKHDASCSALPTPRTDVTLTITKGASSQSIAVDGESGAAYGEVTLASPFGVELTIGQTTVTLEAMDFPSGLTNLTGMLQGEYDAPEGIDVAWDGPAEGYAYTLVPNNHHVGGPTFTECSIAASDGELHIDGDMLVPLSGVTGLEFQGIEHVLFAAAEVDGGCVEIRYVVQQSGIF